MTEAFLTSFLTLFVMVDPIGLTPLFAALTVGATLRERARIALIGVLVAAVLLTLFGLAGDRLLAAFGVSLPAFRIAGGLMLFLVALEMLFQKRTERREETAQTERSDPSVFPFGTPLVAGPGAMASMILLSGGASGAGEEVMIYLGMIAVLGVAFVLCLATELIERLLGDIGIQLLSRVFGMLLGALAVQFVLDGLTDFGVITPA